MPLNETSFGPLGLCLLVLGGLYFLTRLPWWLNKACVPSPEFVEWIQARTKTWGEAAAGWITGFPPTVNAWGFLATPLWLLIISLNLVLLAQSLEVFMPSAQRLEIPFFGSYTWLSLLAGLLFSLSQSTFGVIAGEHKRRSIVVLCMCLVALSIAVEMGLAGYRSYMIITHVVDVDTNTADSLLSKGVALTMFISFLVPTAHTALGFISIPRLLVPMANYLPRLVGGILVGLFAGFMRFFFGFQRVVIVPVGISQLRTETNDLKRRISETSGNCKTQQKNLRDLGDMGTPFSDLQERSAAIAAEAKLAREEWDTRQGELDGRVSTLRRATAPAHGEDEQLLRIMDEAGEFKTAIERRARTRIGDAKRMIVLLESLPKVDQNWHAKHAELTAALPRLARETEQESKDLQNLRAVHQRYVLALDPPVDADPNEGMTGDFRLVELKSLRRRYFEAQKDSERQRINRVLTICTSQLTQFKTDLDAADTAIASNLQAMAEIGKRLTEVTAPPPAPPAVAIEAEKRKLEAAMQEMVTASDAIAASVTRFSTSVKRVVQQQRRKKGGFFAWLKAVFTDFVDAIMGANAEKKSEKPDRDAEMREVQENPSVNLAAGGRE